jgi:hypothetical protein
MTDSSSSTLAATSPSEYVHIDPAVGNYPAKVRVEIRAIDKSSDAAWLTAMLEALPSLLPALQETDKRERLLHFARAMRPGERQVAFRNEMRINGQDFIHGFLRRIPLLTQDEVSHRRMNVGAIEWSDLMQINYAGTTLYVADQFLSDGTLHPTFAEFMKAFREAKFSDWDIAIWWVNSSGWLGGPSPCDVYNEDPELLKTAWEQEIAHRTV